MHHTDERIRKWRFTMLSRCAACAAGFLLTGASEVRGQDAFPQGVASGDVTDSSAMVWTRLPAGGAVRVEISADELFGQLVDSQMLTVDAEADFTVRYDLTGLDSATPYYYRFVYEDTGDVSPVGRFRTAPAAESEAALRFVISGDANAGRQPFRVLDFAAEENPDFWIWCGDTIYGDFEDGDLPGAMDRGGYHAKHRQNREDSSLRALMSQVPVWAQWDDHEVANDYDGGDIEPAIGQDRMMAGQQAFFDYMPIRPADIPDDPRRIYRSFRYGRLAEFFVLDCRQYRSADLGRAGGGPDPYGFLLPLYQPDIVAGLDDPARTMLGAAQLAWLKQSLNESTATWKFVISSVTFTSLLGIPYDRWDGYAAERYDLLRYIDIEGITGVVILSADIHANVYNPDVTRLGRNRLGDSYSPCFAVPEFVSGPIGTATFRQEVAGVGASIFGQDTATFIDSLFFNSLYGLIALRVIDENGLAYLETDRYAYLVVEVTPEGATFRHRVIPSDSTNLAPVVETQHEVTLGSEPAMPCAPDLPLPICMISGMLFCGTGMVRRTLARRKPGCELTGTGADAR